MPLNAESRRGNFNWVHPMQMKNCPRLERTAKFGVMAFSGVKAVPRQDFI